MLTRCPACTTTFRITPDQLRARGGRVRCGRCEARFNALEALQDEPLPQPAELRAVEPVQHRYETRPYPQESAVSPVPDNAPEIQPRLPASAETRAGAPESPSLSHDSPGVVPETETVATDAAATGEPASDTEAAPAPLSADATAASAELRHSLTHFLLGTPVEDGGRQTVPATPPDEVERPSRQATPVSPSPALEESTASANLASEPTTADVTVADMASGVRMPDIAVVPPSVPAGSVSAADPLPPVTDSSTEIGPRPEATAAPDGPEAEAPVARPLATFGEWQDDSSPVPSRRWPWAIAALLASATFLAQAALHYRVELAVLQPQLKPLLARACKPLGCTVTRPRKVEFLGIEASDLHPDPDLPGRLLLSATVRNRAPFVQEFPLLEVTLNDVADRPLIIRDLKPDEYLPADIRVAQGFGINAEIAVNLTLDVGEVPAAGYRLYLFYP